MVLFHVLIEKVRLLYESHLFSSAFSRLYESKYLDLLRENKHQDLSAFLT
ncbi:hypothetical protein NSE_0418 [Neorickettsia sennetsu str. Miyayama]|uniref:Uncharacterized protein n=1 Tax=Ehrlichia sennetsu (strain ATCC VR-367 / Miyayama) TaxID=222891 RepID=Q2GDZ2_EHRS3|nr:hypothetical protein NSE_0418 [Neorickettsia sennetsu str. Miyayama]